MERKHTSFDPFQRGEGAYRQRSIHAPNQLDSNEQRIVGLQQQQEQRQRAQQEQASTKPGHITPLAWRNAAVPTFASVVGGWNRPAASPTSERRPLARAISAQQEEHSPHHFFTDPYRGLPGTSRKAGPDAQEQLRTSSPWLPPSFGPAIDGFRYRASSNDGSVNGENEHLFDWRVTSNGTNVTVPSMSSLRSPPQPDRQPLTHLSSNSLPYNLYTECSDAAQDFRTARAVGHRATASASSSSLFEHRLRSPAESPRTLQWQSNDPVHAWVQGQGQHLQGLPSHPLPSPRVGLIPSSGRPAEESRISETPIHVGPLSSGDLLKEMAQTAASQRVDHPVVRIENIKWTLTFSEVTQFLGNARRASSLTNVHFILDVEGKTCSYMYVEMATQKAASDFIHKQNGTQFAGRSVVVGGSTQECLMQDLFPSFGGRWKGSSAVVDFDDLGEVSVGSLAIFSESDLGSLLERCRLRSARIRKTPERPFYAIASLLGKFPWHQYDVVYLATERDRVFEVTKLALEILGEHHKRKTFETAAEVRNYLLKVALQVPCFTEVQKRRVSMAGGVHVEPLVEKKQDEAGQMVIRQTQTPTNSRESIVAAKLAQALNIDQAKAYMAIQKIMEECRD